MFLQYSNRDLTLIARLLIKKQPDIAAELLSNYHPADPHDHNLQNIPVYFQAFCDHNNIVSEQLAFSRYNSEMVENKRMFIGCILDIYVPDALLYHHDELKHGLVTNVAATLNHSISYVSEMLKEVILQYKVYDDFREKVDECSKKMKGGQREKAA